MGLRRRTGEQIQSRSCNIFYELWGAAENGLARAPQQGGCTEPATEISEDVHRPILSAFLICRRRAAPERAPPCNSSSFRVPRWGGPEIPTLAYSCLLRVQSGCAVYSKPYDFSFSISDTV